MVTQQAESEEMTRLKAVIRRLQTKAAAGGECEKED